MARIADLVIDAQKTVTLSALSCIPVLDSPVTDVAGVGPVPAGTLTLSAITAEYEDTSSFQVVAVDLTLGPDAGNAQDNPKFLAPIMGNVLNSDTLTKEGAYIAGLIGAISVTGAKASDWPVAGVLGIIMDGVSAADGAVVAHIDGDSSVTRAGAAFKAMMRNTVPGSGVDYGIDFYDAGFGSYGVLSIGNAVLRTPNQVVVMEGSGAPTSGATGTGDNFAGTGSLYIDYTNANVYVQAGAITSPDWKLVTRAA